MGRLVAFIIDYMIIIFLLMLLLLLGVVRIKDTYMIINIIKCLPVVYLFFVLNDFFLKGSSIGKKIVGLKTKVKDKNILRFSLIHSFLKLLFGCIWPISLVIFLINHCRMPYDFLYDKNSK